ncbi:RNA-binding S4 domain-containing protein [Garciella nitratireducens]|uniref:RQC P-site tRNA stabilizing factor n=1 Tax=Garciella nitratireducens DSM 15102 TaxID=1121911 RepID=A0A1T4L501_9FIRM|nr:RNA-binding S4 domain-containing protein [Garciella nitratireducens]RBP35473.1 ribosomal 50S subunit-recycling heat shock protein [Garciella nitratireducens]SJZ49789.1 Ribosomal 50S subunit-recycling heat shock protein, contains S4 domain [Garciella nitratireducens DSM 15102]
MRLDKYLKNTRIIKRRTLAKEACNGGKISINGKIAKAGTEVRTGDILTITLGNRVFKIEVLDTSEHITKNQSKEIYRNLD